MTQPELKRAARVASAVASKSGSAADHKKAAELHAACADAIARWMEARGVGFSKTLGYHSDWAEIHKRAAKRKPEPKADPEFLIMKTLGHLMTIRIRRSDIGGLRYYMHSRKRMCVTMMDAGLPEAWFMDGGQNLTETGLATVQELGDWLDKNGARHIRKPRPMPVYRSIYD